MRTLTLDMPAASVMLEGPILKQKLSYMVSARRSWLDFFDNLLSEDDRLNHSSYDYNAKLSYSISPLSTLNLLAYGARDDYHLPVYEGETTSVLRWENQVYQLSYNTSGASWAMQLPCIIHLIPTVLLLTVWGWMVRDMYVVGLSR